MLDWLLVLVIGIVLFAAGILIQRREADIGRIVFWIGVILIVIAFILLIFTRL
jgi:hypothetical protein